MLNHLLATVVSCFWLIIASAQVSSVTPEKPSLGDSIRLAYNRADRTRVDRTRADRTAILDTTAQIYARITVSLDDGSYKKFHQTMEGKGDQVETQFLLPAKAASFRVEFYTLNKDDDKASHYLVVYDDAHRRPVKGAYLDDMFYSNPDTLFEKEIAGYPDNYLAYAKFMNIISMMKDQQTANQQIAGLLKKLTAIPPVNKSEQPGLLAALCIGYAKTGNLSEGKKYLYQLFDRFPQSQATAFAFSTYNYEYYKSSRKWIEDDVLSKVKFIFINYPEAPVSGDANLFQFLMGDKSIPVAAFEKVANPLIDADKLQYYELTNLPELYIDRDTQLSAAERLLKADIKRFQDGTIQHQYRLSNAHYQKFVPFMYLFLARISMLKGDYQAAITQASAANNIAEGSNIEGNISPLLLNVRANAYRQIGNLNLAMRDYQALYKMGNSAALDSMRALFPFCDTKQASFSEFIASASAHVDMAPAPDVTATDLQGKTVHLSNFKGKLIVMNIWGTGCGPCVAEMPLLNQLVKQYSTNPNIVFLAIAVDNTERLNKFLKFHPFDYQVLNNAVNLNEKLDINSMPVHLVIGKNGQIISRSIGARDDIKTYLERLITDNL
jgi:thiol-disulfide isomerase/thioredoxin